MTDIIDGTAIADDALVRHAIAGRRDAFREIYQRHHAPVFRFARAMTGSVAAAEDITQETFLALLRELRRFDPERGSLATYLFAIARNLSRRHLRKDRRFVTLDEPRERDLIIDDPSNAMMQSETVARVRRFIRRLSSRYREVLILCDLQGLTYDDASRILNIPVGTVRSRLHRARTQLTERLTNSEAEATAGVKRHG